MKKPKMRKKKAVLLGQMPQTETDTANASYDRLWKAGEFAVEI